MSRPSFNEEKLLWGAGYEFVAGVDEVGRGAFAGPVVAALVIFPQTMAESNDKNFLAINDSKLILPNKRKLLASYISQACLFSSINVVSVSVINRIGVGKASYIAFRNVLADACRVFNTEKMFALVDGFHIPYVKTIHKRKQKAIIKGDQISVSIAAASIIAKVHRDSLMEQYHKRYTIYDFAENKGYGTAAHRSVIKKYGLCKLHRTSFDLQKFLPT